MALGSAGARPLPADPQCAGDWGRRRLGWGVAGRDSTEHGRVEATSRGPRIPRQQGPGPLWTPKGGKCASLEESVGREMMSPEALLRRTWHLSGTFQSTSCPLECSPASLTCLGAPCSVTLCTMPSAPLNAVPTAAVLLPPQPPGPFVWSPWRQHLCGGHGCCLLAETRHRPACRALPTVYLHLSGLLPGSRSDGPPSSADLHWAPVFWRWGRGGLGC